MCHVKEPVAKRSEYCRTEPRTEPSILKIIITATSAATVPAAAAIISGASKSGLFLQMYLLWLLETIR